MNREQRITLSYLGFGFTLGAVGVLQTGMGEAPAIALDLYGSPLTIAPLRFAIPFVWMAIGYAIASRRTQFATGLLVAHYACAPLAISLNLTREWDGDFSRFQQMLAAEPITFIALLTPYVVGQIATWRLIGLSKRRSADGRGRQTNNLDEHNRK